MIEALLILLSCQLAGEVCVRGLGVPLPGPVAGMALLFVILMLRGRLTGAEAPPRALDAAADALLANLSILFVPAGVASHGIGTARAFHVSTVAVIADHGDSVPRDHALTCLATPTAPPLRSRGILPCPPRGS